MVLKNCFEEFHQNIEEVSLSIQWANVDFHVTIEHPFNCNRVFPRGVMVKAMDYRIIVSEFEFQSHYYVHFRKNTFGKGMNPLILPAMC